MNEYTENDALKYLTKNCYDRAKNAHIANVLYTVFQKCPKTWLAVPFWGQLSENQEFYILLKEWMQLAPTESQSGLTEIASLFGFPK